MTVYAWGTGWRPKNASMVDPTVVGQTIEKLAALSPDGLCATEALVDAAKPAKSPLHPLFSWDNKTAGDLWRKQEARQIILSVSIVKENKDGEPKRVQAPAFINIRKPSIGDGGPASRGYMTTAAVISDKELYRQALTTALAAVRSLQRRFETLTELKPLWAALDKVAADLGVDAVADEEA